MTTESIYIISYTDSIGKTYIVATTNNLSEWLQDNNKERDEPETLETFNIEKINYYSYDNNK